MKIAATTHSSTSKDCCTVTALQGSFMGPQKTNINIQSDYDAKEPPAEALMVQKDAGRERLKRHREEVAGRVLIPDKWGKEELLRDWMDCSSFDALLAPKGIASARAALVAEGRRRASQRLRIESLC